MDEENKNVEGQGEVIKPVEPNNVADNKPNGEGKGFAITSLVLGIVSVVLFCVPWLAILCAIAAIVFGIVALKKPGRGMAIAGIVLGCLAILILILVLIFSVILVASSAGVLEDAIQTMNSTMDSTMYYY